MCTKSDNVLMCLQVSVEGSRWTKFRDKVKHAAEKAGKEALPVVGGKVAGAAIAAAGKKR
jgi:hypothetical protein